MVVVTNRLCIIFIPHAYGLVFCTDYLVRMFFKVRNNLFGIILPTDSHTFTTYYAFLSLDKSRLVFKR